MFAARDCVRTPPQAKNSTRPVSRSYIAPAILIAPERSRSVRTALRRWMHLLAGQFLAVDGEHAGAALAESRSIGLAVEHDGVLAGLE